jgi:hypothetical protein
MPAVWLRRMGVAILFQLLQRAVRGVSRLLRHRPESTRRDATQKFALRPDSSVVERGPEKAGVGGSIPSLATTLPFHPVPLGIKFPLNSLFSAN